MPRLKNLRQQGPELIKAITVKQPWAWAIFNVGKDIENRSWPTNYRGPLVIHAALNFHPEGYMFLKENQRRFDTPIPNRFDFHLGHLMGMVNVVDCVLEHDSFWKHNNQFGFVLENPHEFKWKKKVRGNLGIWNLSPTTEIYKMLNQYYNHGQK